MDETTFVAFEIASFIEIESARAPAGTETKSLDGTSVKALGFCSTRDLMMDGIEPWTEFVDLVTPPVWGFLNMWFLKIDGFDAVDWILKQWSAKTDFLVALCGAGWLLYEVLGWSLIETWGSKVGGGSMISMSSSEEIVREVDGIAAFCKFLANSSTTLFVAVTKLEGPGWGPTDVVLIEFTLVVWAQGVAKIGIECLDISKKENQIWNSFTTFFYRIFFLSNDQ